MIEEYPKKCGLLIPLFSMRREDDHGIGDTLALIEWIDWASTHGVGFLQLLPVNALGSDPDPSPYSAISSVALEPVYLSLDPDWVPGLTQKMPRLPEDMAPLMKPSSPNLVDYPLVRSWKYKVLQQAYEHFASEICYKELRKEFSQWVSEAQDWLPDYVDFKVATKLYGTDIWWQWDETDPDKVRARVSEYADTRVFEEWLQWLCYRQWERVRDHADACGVKLMGDIPIGLSLASADVFFQRHLFDTDWCGGAPAEGDFADDPFTAKWGQNWGIPLYRWDVMERDGYAWWKRRVLETTKIFRMFRIDHILGFYRIYAFPWKPTENKDFLDLSLKEAAKKTGGKLPGFKPRPDNTPEEKMANHRDGDKYLQALLSVIRGVDVVGEDLGCVPDYVRPHMHMLGIPGFIIPHWEILDNGEILMGKDYHECSFATFATHDFPPIAVTWKEIYDRIPPGLEAEHENEIDEKTVFAPQDPNLNDYLRWERRAKREPLINAMIDAKRSLHWFGAYCNLPKTSVEVPWNPMAKTAMFLALFRSNARFVALMYTDLFDINERLNTPGTVGGTNWRPRTPFTAKEAHGLAQSVWLKRIIVQSGRGTILGEQRVDETKF